jgi:hypothetical protein
MMRHANCKMIRAQSDGSELWRVNLRSKDAMAQGSRIEGSFEYVRKDREKESFSLGCSHLLDRFSTQAIFDAQGKA